MPVDHGDIVTVMIGGAGYGNTVLCRLESAMTLDRAVLAFAGTVVLLSALLTWLASPWWLLLTCFAGLNMIQSAFTGFCPAAMLFRAFGVRSGTAF